MARGIVGAQNVGSQILLIHRKLVGRRYHLTHLHCLLGDELILPAMASGRATDITNESAH